MITVSKDENGQYFFDGKRMLVSHERGKVIARYAKHYTPSKPDLTREYYPGPWGTTVAIVVNGEIRLGYSSVNFTEGDKFNRNLGVTVAINRALYDNVKPPFEDHRPEIAAALKRMERRSHNYFKL